MWSIKQSNINMEKNIFTVLIFLIAVHTVSGQVVSFYKLSLQWPKSFCTDERNQCLDPITDLGKFTIHGLWPQLKDDSPVPPYNDDNSCTKLKPVNPKDLPNLLKNLVQDLKKDWPNLIQWKNNQANMRFWQYEWKQHGMCSLYAERPKSYFQLASKLRTQYDILGMLRIKGIIPDPAGKANYMAQSISDAISNGLKHVPHVHCNKNRSRRFQLLEIRICFDNNVNNVINCPTPFTNCMANSTVYFPH